jgi:hypothetical protein
MNLITKLIIIFLSKIFNSILLLYQTFFEPQSILYIRKIKILKRIIHTLIKFGKFKFKFIYF